MKKILLSFAEIFLISLSTAAQEPLPEGASKFFKGLGGLNFSDGSVDLFQRVAGNKIDRVEGGGGAEEWTKVDGRVFVRANWRSGIGEIGADQGHF